MRFTAEFLDDLKGRVAISDVVGTRVAWPARANRNGEWTGPCPFHGAKTGATSFGCNDRKGVFSCLNCGVGGDTLNFFQKLDGVSFVRSVEMVAAIAGIMIDQQETDDDRRQRETRAEARRRDAEKRRAADDAAKARKAENVHGIWRESTPVGGTLAERYLLGRGIPKMEWPASLRYHHGMNAVVCGVQAPDRKLIAIWRIYLDEQGNAKVHDGKKVKLGLGPAAGGAVRLGPQFDEVLVCEGVETGFGVGCLNAWTKSVWSLLSTSGMINWEPPEGIKSVVIYSDGDRFKVKQDGTVSDPPGRMAANKLRDKLTARGIRISIKEPPTGTDWLDVWVGLTAETSRERDVEYLSD